MAPTGCRRAPSARQAVPDDLHRLDSDDPAIGLGDAHALHRVGEAEVRVPEDLFRHSGRAVARRDQVSDLGVIHVVDIGPDPNVGTHSSPVPSRRTRHPGSKSTSTVAVPRRQAPSRSECGHGPASPPLNGDDAVVHADSHRAAFAQNVPPVDTYAVDRADPEVAVECMKHVSQDTLGQPRARPPFVHPHVLMAHEDHGYAEPMGAVYPEQVHPVVQYVLRVARIALRQLHGARPGAK